MKMYWSTVDYRTRRLLTLDEIEDSIHDGHHVDVEWW